MAEEEAPQPIEYPLYQLQSQTPLGDLSNLQNTYGTAAMPVLTGFRVFKQEQVHTLQQIQQTKHC